MPDHPLAKEILKARLDATAPLAGEGRADRAQDAPHHVDAARVAASNSRNAARVSLARSRPMDASAPASSSSPVTRSGVDPYATIPPPPGGLPPTLPEIVPGYENL